MARPRPLADVTCPQHPHQPVDDCVVCYTSMQVSLYFHNLGRCIERVCIYPHALQAADDGVSVSLPCDRARS